MKQSSTIFAVIALVSLLFLLACSATRTSPAQNDASSASNVSKSTPSPISAQMKTLRLTAPKPVVDLWKKWHGKYVMFAHRSSSIKEFNDLNGKVLMCALINTDDILGDAAKFKKAANIEMSFAIQNTVDMYGNQFLENPNAVGFMVPSIAEYYKFENDNRLIQILFE